MHFKVLDVEWSKNGPKHWRKKYITVHRYILVSKSNSNVHISISKVHIVTSKVNIVTKWYILGPSGSIITFLLFCRLNEAFTSFFKGVLV